MNFGQAIELLKRGVKVARIGWNGKGMWLKLMSPPFYQIHKLNLRGFEDVEELLPWIGMCTADKKFVPWLASQTDMLAEDWQEVAV